VRAKNQNSLKTSVAAMNRLPRNIFTLLICMVWGLSNPLCAGAGFIYDWRPFTADSSLEKNGQDKIIPDEHLSLFHKEIFSLDEEKNSRRYEKDRQDFPAERKSDWSNVKIVFTPSAEEASDKEKGLHFTPEDKQLEKLVYSLQSLIHDDKKIKALEEIGGMFEPQVKFYLNF